MFVGDNLPADIGGAQSVGMRAVWRVTETLDERRSGDDGDEITPDGTIVTLHDLLPLLDTLVSWLAKRCTHDHSF